MNRLLTLLAVTCLLLVVSAGITLADTVSAPIADVERVVPHVQGVIVADGELDEAIWTSALVMTLDFEVRPAENEPPPVKTELLMAYGENELFVAFRAFDPEPDKIRARLRDRDNVGPDDWVAINLDTFNDARRSFLFMCNPLGVQSDIIETTDGSTSYDAIWDSGGRIHDWGYAVEMVIPFSALRFPKSANLQTWGVDAIRSYPRAVRHHIGLFARDRDNNCYLCQATKVVGFEGARPGSAFELDPTISGTFSQERPEDNDYGPFMDDARNLDMGLTARWGVTPNLTFTGSVNPDFSQVEADAAQLDVNRQFALYYDERRPFFLEGADVFDTHRPLVHTRTIADPIWGAKLTGKEGPHGVGLFLAQDDITNLLLPGRDGSDNATLSESSLAGVARYRYDLGDNASTIGGLATVRESESGYGNRMASIDGTFDLSQQDRLRVQTTGTWTEYPDTIQSEYDQDASLAGGSYYGRYTHQTRNWDTWLFGGQRHPDFRADLGFVSRTDFSYWGGGTEYVWNNPTSGEWWSNTYSGIDYEDVWDYAANTHLETETGAWWGFNGTLESWVHVFAETRREWYEGEKYNGDNLFVGGGFRPNAATYVGLEGGLGKQIDYTNERPGNEWWLGPEFGLALGRHLNVYVNHNYTAFDVDDGRLFTANISYGRFIWQFTRELFVRVIVQRVHYDFDRELYNDPDDQDDVYQRYGTQFLASYKLNPQTVVYLGYSDNVRAVDNQALYQSDRVFFFKLGYAWVL